MTLSEIEEKLISQVASMKSREEKAIAPNIPFHDLGIDSLGFVEILVFIEKTFNLSLIDSGLDRKDFETISSLAAFIHQKI